MKKAMLEYPLTAASYALQSGISACMEMEKVTSGGPGLSTQGATPVPPKVECVLGATWFLGELEFFIKRWVVFGFKIKLAPLVNLAVF